MDKCPTSAPQHRMAKRTGTANSTGPAPTYMGTVTWFPTWRIPTMRRAVSPVSVGPTERLTSISLLVSCFANYCNLADLVELCKGYPLVREPQKTLLGFATATVLAGSLIECLEFCFLEYRRGANCKSVMYFYDVGEDSGLSTSLA